MLKIALLHPANPRRAETRPLPSFVLDSEASSTYPTRGQRAGLGRLGAGRGDGRASGASSSAVALGGHFEHPASPEDSNSEAGVLPDKKLPGNSTKARSASSASYRLGR